MSINNLTATEALALKVEKLQSRRTPYSSCLIVAVTVDLWGKRHLKYVPLDPIEIYNRKAIVIWEAGEITVVWTDVYQVPLSQSTCLSVKDLKQDYSLFRQTIKRLKASVDATYVEYLNKVHYQRES